MHKLPYFPLLFYTQEQNKDEIMQCLMIHDTILKHKAIVDQLRKGLSILGFLNELEKHRQSLSISLYTVVMMFHLIISSPCLNHQFLWSTGQQCGPNAVPIYRQCYKRRFVKVFVFHHWFKIVYFMFDSRINQHFCC